MSVTVVLAVNVLLQVVLVAQLIPAGDDVTEPFPTLETVNV